MESSGDEARIRALFCELKLADEAIAPNFSSMWSRAQTQAPQSTYQLLRPAIVINIALVITVLAVALWLQNSSRESRPTIAAIGPLTLAPLIPTPEAPPSNNIKSARAAYRRILHRKKLPITIPEANIHEAVAISTWQSPTARFLQSPTESLVNTLPQLNQSVRELQLFLPHKQLKELSQ